MEREDDRTLTTEKRIAKQLNISVRTARRLRTQKILPYYRIGRTIRYDQRECQKALEDYRVKTNAEQREGQK